MAKEVRLRSSTLGGRLLIYVTNECTNKCTREYCFFTFLDARINDQNFTLIQQETRTKIFREGTEEIKKDFEEISHKKSLF